VRLLSLGLAVEGPAAGRLDVSAGA
jgi:hypothetical protein